MYEFDRTPPTTANLPQELFSEVELSLNNSKTNTRWLCHKRKPEIQLDFLLRIPIKSISLLATKILARQSL
jgi:hypothetical protein